MNHCDHLKIRYVKLHFTVEFTDASELLPYKASALRGGMGEMLLRGNCVRDRNCDECDFAPECLVRRIMYSKMEIQPAFMSSGDSVGYVIECEDYRERYEAGDRMEFSMILFGKTIVYFAQILNAFYALGMQGLGKEQSRFRIVSVTNSKREPIMSGNDIDMSRYRIQTVADYVRYRRRQIDKGDLPYEIRFQSPLSLKYRQNELREFIPDAIIEAVARRIYILDCFEGIESDLTDRGFLAKLPTLDVTNERHKVIKVKRYSNHKKSAMFLEGIEGVLGLSTIPEELLDMLLAGELIHIGKNTSFGFGRYRVM
ncbi:MAG: CRISPR system precrRNA processing endoribonuclease RAMP protein Cas6 [Lachnospiraceae bacterium]|nr:CRISPR system precrRNA processing endoribonuclease RAMP protein Cas6 [Lachnospiraceae bacterium]